MSDPRSSSRRSFLKPRLTGAVALGASRRIERSRVEGFLGHVLEPSPEDPLKLPIIAVERLLPWDVAPVLAQCTCKDKSRFNGPVRLCA